MYYREWTKDHRYRAGRMVSRKALVVLLESDNTGYASNYYFCEEDAQEIKRNRSIKGFKRAAVGADFCLIDIDQPEERDAVEAALQGLTYKVYSTGGKGFHILVPHQWVFGENVPYSHLSWTKGLGLNVDPTSFQPQRIVSLPGCVHRKTGKKKHLIKTVYGKLLNLELVDPPERAFPDFDVETEEDSDVFLRIAEAMESNVKPGMRHTVLWGLGKDMARSGLKVKTAVDIANLINGCWDDPKDEGEVELAVIQGFNQAYE